MQSLKISSVNTGAILIDAIIDSKPEDWTYLDLSNKYPNDFLAKEEIRIQPTNPNFAKENWRK